jgi:hypothetical protein
LREENRLVHIRQVPHQFWRWRYASLTSNPMPQMVGFMTKSPHRCRTFLNGSVKVYTSQIAGADCPVVDLKKRRLSLQVHPLARQNSTAE